MKPPIQVDPQSQGSCRAISSPWYKAMTHGENRLRPEAYNSSTLPCLVKTSSFTRPVVFFPGNVRPCFHDSTFTQFPPAGQCKWLHTLPSDRFVESKNGEWSSELLSSSLWVGQEIKQMDAHYWQTNNHATLLHTVSQGKCSVHSSQDVT